MRYLNEVDYEQDGKKKVKKGFKADRRANYERNRLGRAAGKDGKKGDDAAPQRVKSIVFDDRARREYLLTMHKKKNERRVQAFVDSRTRARRESAKMRQSQKEQARQAYNRFARVPILPNYTFQLPKPEEDEEEEAEEEAEDEGRGGRRAVTAAHTTHAVPREMGGADDDDAAGVAAAFGTAEVEVRPLFPSRAARATLPTADFSDLPRGVEEELIRLRRESKGPARTKPRVHVLKELEKIRRISKYSRKGHGKRTTSGKRKNRKK